MILIVCLSTTSNCEGSVIEPVENCDLPTGRLTTRSSDHFTSSAVTGLPSWNVAFWRKWNVMVRLSSEIVQRSASSPSIAK